MKNIGNFFVSFLIIVLGILIFFDGRMSIGVGFRYINKAGYVDISKVKEPSGIIMIILGCFALWIAIEGRIDENKGKGDYKADSTEHLVCPKCKNVYEKEEIDFTECPNCKVKLLTTLEFLEKRKRERKWWQE